MISPFIKNRLHKDSPVRKAALSAAAVALVNGLITTPAVAQISASKAIARVAMQSHVEVKKNVVTLGDIANISSPSLPVLLRLMALPIGQVPSGGEAVSLERETLRRWIRIRTGIEAEQISWDGSRVSSIELATTNIKGEKIVHSAQEQLQSLLIQRGLRGEISAVQIPQDISVPAGNIELKARQGAAAVAPSQNTPFDPMLAKRQSVWMDIFVDGRFIRTVPVSFDVSVYAPAYVASQSLPIGKVLDPHELSVREVEWSGRNQLPLTPETVLVSTSGKGRSGSTMRLRHALKAGQTLTYADVEAVPAVARGDYAILHVINGPLELESRVEVLQDGFSGEMVRVKLPSASSAILARVTGDGLLEVRQ